MGKVTKNSLLSILKKYHLKAKQSFNDVNDNISEIKNELSTKSNPNLLINGDFQVWQRGESLQYNNNTYRKYICDRWLLLEQNSNSIHLLCERDNTDIMYKNCMKLTITNNHGSIFLRQRLEQVLPNNSPITLSFMIKGVAGSRVTSSIDDTTYRTTVLTGEWQKVTFTNPNYERFRIGAPFAEPIRSVDKLGTYYITNVKLELGSVATPFVPRPYAEELAMCQRYYERIYPHTTENTLYAATTDLTFYYYYTNNKRVLPTVKVVGTLNSADGIVIGSKKDGLITGERIDTLNNTVYNNTVKLVTKGTYTETQPYVLLFNSSNAYIELDAEIY